MTATPQYRLSQAAQADIVRILVWSEQEFGPAARDRYQALIATGLRDIAERPPRGEARTCPDLGAGVFVWHLRQSKNRVPGGRVHRPRHFLVYRLDGDLVVVGRVLHDAMQLDRHVDDGGTWH
jgi:toxin ParE1/3/4